MQTQGCRASLFALLCTDKSLSSRDISQLCLYEIKEKAAIYEFEVLARVHEMEEEKNKLRAAFQACRQRHIDATKDVQTQLRLQTLKTAEHAMLCWKRKYDAICVQERHVQNLIHSRDAGMSTEDFVRQLNELLINPTEVTKTRDDYAQAIEDANEITTLLVQEVPDATDSYGNGGLGILDVEEELERLFGESSTETPAPTRSKKSTAVVTQPKATPADLPAVPQHRSAPSTGVVRTKPKLKPVSAV